MAAGNMTDGVGHRHHTQTKGQGHADQSNADLRESRRNDCAAAARECQPESPDGFCGVFF
jgi:hypothetical protein